MGILDEAIREHLDLKRKHGADETELKGLEDDAFGQADRPDATDPAPAAEAETRIISPEEKGTTGPATEGEKPDQVPELEPEATFAEHPIPEPPAPAAEAKPEPGPEPLAGADVTDAATVESPEAKPAEPAPEAPEQSGGDAGDMLEAERHHLSSHPTEHYDVDAAIAEEDEIDILSESSLSDELDRALDSGETAPAADSAAEEAESGPESGAFEEAPASDESAMVEPEPVEADSAEELYEDAAVEEQPVEEEAEAGEEAEAEEEPGDQADFFDQDDVLEATPDFLEETPEHDQLWFEQKQPKDFDFGD